MSIATLRMFLRLPAIGRGLRPALFALALATAEASLAQTTGDVQGSVSDAGGGPLQDATVMAASPALQGQRRTAADGAGRFRIPALPPGIYTLTASLPGFADARRVDVSVELGATTTVPLTLILATEAQVTVSGEVPLLDTASTKIGTYATAQTIERLPLGRNYASVASIAPGAGQDKGGITIYGATGRENSYLIDGLETTSVINGAQGRQLNAEFVEEVEVRTGGYEAEFGRVWGASINVVTKSGGNEYHGGGFGYYDSGSLTSANKNAPARIAANEAADELPVRKDAGFHLGGALLKDRLWFFAAYDRVASDLDYRRVESQTSTPAGVVPTLKSGTDRTRTDIFAAKLTLHAGPVDAAVSVFGDPSRQDGRNLLYGSTPGPDSAVITPTRMGGTDVTGRVTGIFGRFLLEGRAGYHSERDAWGNDFADRLAIEEFGPGTDQFVPGSGPKNTHDNIFRRIAAGFTATAFLGAHEVKAGVSWERLASSFRIAFGGGEQVYPVLDDNAAFDYAEHLYYAATPLDCVVKTDGSTGSFGFVDPTTCNAWRKADASAFSARADGIAVFLQDSWRIAGNLTLNAGLRYEEQRFRNPQGDVRLALTGEWSPRVGAVWDPLGNGRSKVFASYGRYYQLVPQSVQAKVLSDQFLIDVFNSTGYASDTVNRLADSAAVYGNDYVPPGLSGIYSDEVVGGIEYEVVPGWTAGVKGIYRAIGRMLEDRCDVYDPRAGITDLVPAEAQTGCVLVNVGEGALGHIPDPLNPDCWQDFPNDTKQKPCDSVRGQRYFRGLQADLRHRSRRLFLQASYLFSRLVGNYDGFVNQRQPGVSPATSSDFNTIDLVANSFGRLSLDRTHQLQLSGAYTFPFGLSAGVVAAARSGAPTSVIRDSPDGPVYLAPRGSFGELPWTYQVDFHLEHRFALGSLSIVPVVDVFNLTNVQQVTAVDDVYARRRTDDVSPPFIHPSNPSFGQPTDFQSPRLVRLGLRVSF